MAIKKKTPKMTAHMRHKIRRTLLLRGEIYRRLIAQQWEDYEAETIAATIMPVIKKHTRTWYSNY